MVAALKDFPPGPEGDRAAYLDLVRELTGVPLTGITCYGMGPDASFELTLEGDRTVSMTAAQVGRFAAWRQLAMTTGGDLVAAPEKGEWLKAQRCMQQILVVVADPDSQERAESLQWVRSVAADAIQLHERVTGKELGEVLVKDWPFYQGGELIVRSADVARAARDTFKARPKPAEITRRLAALGFERRSITATVNGRAICRSVWAAPREALEDAEGI